MTNENGFDDLLKSFISMAEEKTETQDTWREVPVDLLTFFKSNKFLKESPYPGKQTEALETINKIIWSKLDKHKTFDEKDYSKITEGLLIFGKGSGKDFLASGILAYFAYVLNCMSNPQKFFGFGQGEPIDLINVAVNSYQANNVFFKKLKARLANCDWFKPVNYYPKAYNEYQTTKNQIRFFNGITAHSAHSEAEAYEGFNPLLVIFDEISGYDYKNAVFAYNTLRSSAVSRFNDKMLLIFISYPRSQEDFLMQKYNNYLMTKDESIFAMIGKSWEVNPKIKRESLQKDYDRDPEGAMCKYECIPPAIKQGFFQFPEKIDEVVKIGKKAQCHNIIIQDTITSRTIANGETKYYSGIEIFNLNLEPSFTYYIGGDGGVNSDSYVISLFHGEPTPVTVVENGETVEKLFNKPVEDLLLVWIPSKKERLPVDLLNVADVLSMICSKVHVKKALFDKFNSAEVVQRLISYGVDAEDKNWSNQFQLQLYQNLKNLIYTGQIELLDHTVDYGINANEELKHIQIINGNKIDHLKDKSKDMSDARAAAAWLCITDEPDIGKNYSMPAILGVKPIK